MITPKLHVRFWKNVIKTPECWLWTGATHIKDRYGKFKIASGRSGGRHVYAHRFAYEQAKGRIPPGLHVDHTCSVRTCVNPLHLQAVTPRRNAQLSHERGRHKAQYLRATNMGEPPHRNASQALLKRAEGMLWLHPRAEFWCNLVGFGPKHLTLEVPNGTVGANVGTNGASLEM
jgi:hypothetical protein